jgi:hypothetical protein
MEKREAEVLTAGVLFGRLHERLYTWRYAQPNGAGLIAARSWRSWTRRSRIGISVEDFAEVGRVRVDVVDRIR